MGLIPARAGNTTSFEEAWNGIQAHPRSRGEHPGSTWNLAGLGGSSPLARGTREDLDPDAIAIGLIPARAGNTA